MASARSAGYPTHGSTVALATLSFISGCAMAKGGESPAPTLVQTQGQTPPAVPATQPWRRVGWGPLVFVWGQDHPDGQGVVGGAEFSALACIDEPNDPTPSKWILLEGNRLWLKGAGGQKYYVAGLQRGQFATSQPYDPNDPTPHVTTGGFDEWELTDYIARAYESLPSGHADKRHTPFFTGNGWKHDGDVTQPGALWSRVQAYCNRMDITPEFVRIEDRPHSGRGRVVAQLPPGGYVGDVSKVWVVLDEGDYSTPTGDTSASAFTLLISANGSENAAYISRNSTSEPAPSTQPQPHQACVDGMRTAREVYWKLPKYGDNLTRDITITNTTIAEVVISVWEANGPDLGRYVDCDRGRRIAVRFTAESDIAYYIVVDPQPSQSFTTPNVTVPFEEGRVSTRASATVVTAGSVIKKPVAEKR